jgi:hypothetical protein
VPDLRGHRRELRAMSVDVAAAIAHDRAHGDARLGGNCARTGRSRWRARAPSTSCWGARRVPGSSSSWTRGERRPPCGSAPLGLGWAGAVAGVPWKLEEARASTRASAADPAGPPSSRWCAPSSPGLGAGRPAPIVFSKAGGGTEIPSDEDGGRLWGLSEDREVQLLVRRSTTRRRTVAVSRCCRARTPAGWRHLGGLVPAAQVPAAEADARKVALDVVAGVTVLLRQPTCGTAPEDADGAAPARLLGLLPARARALRRTKRTPRFFDVFPPAGEAERLAEGRARVDRGAGSPRAPARRRPPARRRSLRRSSLPALTTFDPLLLKGIDPGGWPARRVESHRKRACDPACERALTP